MDSFSELDHKKNNINYKKDNQIEKWEKREKELNWQFI